MNSPSLRPRVTSLDGSLDSYICKLFVNGMIEESLPFNGRVGISVPHDAHPVEAISAHTLSSLTCHCIWSVFHFPFVVCSSVVRGTPARRTQQQQQDTESGDTPISNEIAHAQLRTHVTHNTNTEHDFPVGQELCPNFRPTTLTAT